MTMVFCRTCGVQLDETALFCPQCGAPQAVQPPEPRRSFGTAIAICMRKYVVYRGRAPRAELWYFLLFTTLCSIVAAILDAGYSGGVLTLLVNLIFLLPGSAVQVRRMHDLDRSGWWLLIVLLPVVGAILLFVWCCQRGTPGPNRFGPDPLAGGFRSAYPAR